MLAFGFSPAELVEVVVVVVVGVGGCACLLALVGADGCVCLLVLVRSDGCVGLLVLVGADGCVCLLVLRVSVWALLDKSRPETKTAKLAKPVDAGVLGESVWQISLAELLSRFSEFVGPERFLCLGTPLGTVGLWGSLKKPKMDFCVLGVLLELVLLRLVLLESLGVELGDVLAGVEAVFLALELGVETLLDLLAPRPADFRAGDD